MSGANAPVAKALQWCGWDVMAYDWEISAEHDLGDKNLQQKLLAEVNGVDFWMVAMDCGTLSRARERPIPSHPNPPKPLRSAEHPGGVPGLSQRDAERVRRANDLITFFCNLLTAASGCGSAGMLENPLRAWLWAIEEVQQLLKLPQWDDYDYWACALGGARAKGQRIRGNVSELTRIRCECRHVHSPDEWRPWRDNDTNRWIYPSSAEQEYTAELAFCIATAASAWAVRTGRARIRVPRSPKPVETGSRVEWLDFDPAVCRVNAMTGLAIRLGLQPPPGEESRYPHLLRIPDLKELPKDFIYIGRGNLKMRLAQTKWASPFTVGPHGTAEACLRRYAHWLQTQPDLLREAQNLQACALVCDCPAGQACHGEALIAEATRPARPKVTLVPRETRSGRQRRSPPARTTAATLATTATAVVPSATAIMGPTIRWSQGAMDNAIRKLFPPEATAGFKMPCLEDILNDHPFCTYADWLDECGISQADAAGSPSAGYSEGWRAVALGTQRGAVSSKGAVEPIIGFGLGRDDHFSAAQALADAGASPWAEAASADYDLRFAAAELVRWRKQLRCRRQATSRAVAELSMRCEPLGEHLRRRQPPSVAKIACRVHVGLIAVLVLVMGWPDWRLPSRFLDGFQVVGTLERTHIFEEQSLEPPIPKSELLANSLSLIASIETDKPHEEIDFIWESCQKEHTKGFGSDLMPREHFDQVYGRGSWSPIPAFCVVQSCGKKRRIDNGRRGGQNAATTYSEKSRLCSAFQPGLHVRLIHEEADRAGVDLKAEGIQLESGGEDLPDAFRSIPCRPEDLDINIVAARDPDTLEVHYQQIYAMVFGLSSAVIQFGRWSKFLECLGRRVLALLWAMYVDDGTLTDAAQAKGAGQALVVSAFERLGTPFAEAKRTRMSSTGVFLGVEHDFTDAVTRGVVTFEPSAKLIVKAKGQLQEMKDTRKCTPGAATKFRGTAGFCAHAFWGRVGRAGFGPFRQRQYSDIEPWALSYSMERSIAYFDVIFEQRPRRHLDCAASDEPLIVIASDAQAEPGTQPGAGYLLLDARTGERRGRCCPVPEDLLEAWGYGEDVRSGGGNPIANCEAAVIAAAAMAEGHALAGHQVVWFVDNTTALYAFVKGTSANASVERAAHILHFMACKLNIKFWFEFVDSEANWSDGISRDLMNDRFSKEHSFKLDNLEMVTAWWRMDLVELWGKM